jgi:hypothetical protein
MFFKKNLSLDSYTFNLKRIGVLKLNKNADGYYWFGTVPNITPENLVELTIEVKNKVEPTIDQIEMLLTFSKNIQNLEQVLFLYMLEAFKKAKSEIKLEDIQKTFYLSAIELKRNKEDIWVALEHNGISSEISDFIPRFTIKNQKVVWSNVQ